MGFHWGNHSRRWERDGNTNVKIPSGGYAPSHYGPCDLWTWCGDRAFPCWLRVVLKGNHPTVEQRCNTFYIRAANCDSRCEDFRQLKEWKSVEVGYERYDVTSVSIDNLIEGKSYRLVVQRSPLKDKEGKQRTDMFGVIYTYRCILTNNRTSTEKDIITSRKASLIFIMSVEQAKRTSIYRTMTSDGHICPFLYGWEHGFPWWLPPCWRTSISISSRHISDKVKPLKKTSRLKAFILHFVSVPAKWVRTGRQNVLNLYTNKTYYAEVFIE